MRTIGTESAVSALDARAGGARELRQSDGSDLPARSVAWDLRRVGPGRARHRRSAPTEAVWEPTTPWAQMSRYAGVAP